MKPSFVILLAVAAVSHGLTSCCSPPPILCCPCADSTYRPLGRPGTPGEAYSAGYVCGQRDRRDGVEACLERHRGEVATGLQEYEDEGYADGYAGRVQTSCAIPDQRKATRLYR
ncbi:MAG: hypothetical protein ACKV19_12215 [Verrucomicrobiales bacterium]